MDLDQRERLRANFGQLVQDMVIDHMFMSLLIRDQILTFEHAEQIQNMPTASQKAFVICMTLPKRGPKAFPVLIEALVKTGQNHLAELLDAQLAKEWSEDGGASKTNTLPKDTDHMNDLTRQSTSTDAAMRHRLSVAPFLDGDDADSSKDKEEHHTPLITEERVREFSVRGPHSDMIPVSLDLLRHSLSHPPVSIKASRGTSYQFARLIHKGNDEEVHASLRKGANANALDGDGISVLYIAAAQGRGAIVRALVEYGADVRFTRPKVSDTPLHAAARGKHSDIVSYLLRHGALVNQTDAQGLSVLHVAAFAGAYTTVGMLIKSGASVNACMKNGLSVLHAAVEGASLNIVTILLDKGANANQKDNEGWLPAHVAACWGHDSILGRLIERGTIVQSITRDGNSMLHLAAQSGSAKCVRLLLEAHIDVNIKDRNHLRAIYTAVQGGHLECVQTLLEFGAKVNSHEAPVSVIHVAAYHGDYDIFKALVDHAGDISVTTSSGLTALHAAAFGGSIAITKLLLQKGADMNAKTVDNWTIAHAAARGKRKDVLEYLISCGVNINARTRINQSVLQAAVRSGDVETARVALNNGANFDLDDNMWWAILRDLQCKGNTAMLDLLLDHGTDLALDSNAGRCGSFRSPKKKIPRMFSVRKK